MDVWAWQAAKLPMQRVYTLSHHIWIYHIWISCLFISFLTNEIQMW
jgi:hypothetical protein